MQKKLMLLGGIRYLLPAIEVAHKYGHKVITVDYLPNNIAHKYSDEYYNVSILDKEAVLKLARVLKIDGILSYAVDPGVVTAAYVAEQMGLPFSCSYESACILQDKALFRQYLRDNGFNVPNARGYDQAEDALKDVDYFNWPVIVKPVDSAGSKGVSRVDNPKDLGTAIQYALSESHNGHFIIEDFLEKEGLSSGSESFFVDGELKYNAFYDQYFDNEAANPYTPSAEIWPTEKAQSVQDEIKEELQRLGNLLGFRTGLFNIEWRVCKNGKVYLMEVSPRAGGNRLAEILNYATDVDIIEAEVLKALGENIPEVHEPNYNGAYAIWVLHSRISGVFDSVLFAPSLFTHLIEKEVRVQPGQNVKAFMGANDSIGTIFIKAQDRSEMNILLKQIDNKVKIIVSQVDKDEFKDEILTHQQTYDLLLEFDDTFITPLSRSINLKDYSLKLSNHARFMCVKDISNKAFIAYYLNKDTSNIYIPLIAVKQKYQHLGIASRMLDKLTSLYRDYDCIRLEVKSDNKKAYRFYIKKGFHPVENRDDKILLEKLLK